MNAAVDNPLDLPPQTLRAIEQARSAAAYTRYRFEIARSLAFAAMGITFVGLGAFVLAGKAPLPDVVRWGIAGMGLVTAWSGVILIYWFIITWVRSGRQGSLRSPFGNPLCAGSWRARLIALAVCLLFVFGEASLLNLLRGRVPDAVYYGILIWGTRLCAALGVGFYIYRYTRVPFWEYLAYAAALTGTWGVYMFASPRLATTSPLPACCSALAMAAAVVATGSILKRQREWRQETGAMYVDGNDVDSNGIDSDGVATETLS